MHKNLQAVILAGGKGTRLNKITKKTPKAMVLINGVPFLEILINQIKKQGIDKILVLTGYKGKIIEDYIKKKKDKNIVFHRSHIKYQTLSRIINAKKLILNNFLLMYCDNYLINFNLKKTLKIYKKNKSNIILSVVKKKKNQKGNVLFKKKNIVYQKGLVSNYVEAGYMMINKSNLFRKKLQIFNQNTDFSKILEHYSLQSKLKIILSSKGFFCIESSDLMNQTNKYFKNKLN